MFAKVQRALNELGARRVDIGRSGTPQAIRSTFTRSRSISGLKTFSGRMIVIGCSNSLQTDRERPRLMVLR